MDKMTARWLFIWISVLTAASVTLSGFQFGLRAVRATEVDATVADIMEAELLSGNSGCLRIWEDPDPVEFAYNWYDCTDPKVWLSWITSSYSELYGHQGTCDQQITNPSYYVKVTINMCEGDTSPGGVLRGFTAPFGSLVVNQTFGSGQTMVTSTCFDSCNWPNYWELILTDQSGEVGIEEIFWDVGCCTCTSYSDPCI